MEVKWIFCLSIILLTYGCVGNRTLELNYSSLNNASSVLSHISPLNIKVDSIEMSRPKGGISNVIGERTAAFGVPMGMVLSEKPIPELTASAISKEFERCGHRIVETGQDFALHIEIQEFWVKTNTTPLYWDVIAETKTLLKASGPNGLAIPMGTYQGTAQERTYLNPSEKLMNKLMIQALDRAVKNISASQELVSFLRNKPAESNP